MNILILGSAGFIGSSLVKHFDQKAVIFGCDLLELPSPAYEYRKISVLSSDFESFISMRQFDVCINASGSSTVSYSFTQPVSDFDANGVVVVRVLEALRKFQPNCKFVQISSAAVYGNPEQLPVSESAGLKPVSPYGYHKWISELLCREYCSLFSVPSVILRPFSVYGAGLRKQLLWDISTMIKNKGIAELSGTGNESRDFIHIQDLCRAIEVIIKNAGFNGEAINAASGTEVTISEISNLLAEYYNGKIVFNGLIKSGDPLNWRADITAISSLGYSPSVSLREGVTDYAKWFMK